MFRNFIVVAVITSALIGGLGAPLASEAAFGPGITRPGTGSQPSSTNPGPCITFPSGRLYCGS